ncbi:polysaccharide deacetylase family protein [Arthrobacter alpinus]|uniref:polysaccharide deacetylase family protein n=1 Tax=Arthrobacter alpinus TaxID=656366 RepID=UPI0016449D1C|nr:polysaccharide deacetylase family protein [Arthrobacter alpinus]
MNRLRNRLAPVLKPIIYRHSAFVGSIVRVETEKPVVVMTYDDGPEPGGTDRVLAALAEHHASATFFMLLSRVRTHRNLLADVLNDGHEIALHGIDHKKLTDLSMPQIRQKTLDGKHELEDATGREISWMRPPYGYQTLSSRRAVLSTGLEPVMWSSTTWDSLDISQNERVLKAVTGLSVGSILLAHDGRAGQSDGANDGPAPDIDRGDLSRRVLDELSKVGIVGRSLGQALEHGAPFRAAWFQKG